MKHLEDLFSVLPTFVLKWLFALLLEFKLAETVRTALYYELRFREQIEEEVAASRREVYGRSVTFGRTVRGQA